MVLLILIPAIVWIIYDTLSQRKKPNHRPNWMGISSYELRHSKYFYNNENTHNHNHDCSHGSYDSQSGDCDVGGGHH